MPSKSIIKLKIKDLLFASKVCKNKSIRSKDLTPTPPNTNSVTARAVFVDIYSDIVMDIARSFSRENIYAESTFITIKGSSFPITDEIMDTYLWLLKEGFKKCCLYQGKNGAPLSHYMHTVLRSKFTKIDYIRYKTGVTTNIPKCITTLGTSYKTMFLLLRQKKSRNYICSKLDFNTTEYQIRKNKIVNTLYADGKEDLIIDSITEEFSDATSINKILDVNKLQIINRFTENIIPVILKTFPKSNIRFMIEYWGRKSSVNSIYNSWKDKLFSKYLNELHIKTPKDFYKVIENIISETKQRIEHSFPKEFADYPNIEIKTLLAEYFRNWVTEQELYSKNEEF